MNKLLGKLDPIRLKILARIVFMCNTITNRKKVKIIDLSYELADLLLRDPRDIINQPMPHTIHSTRDDYGGNISDSENETKTNFNYDQRRKSDSFKDVKNGGNKNVANSNNTLQVDLSVIRESSMSSKEHSEDYIVQSPNDKERESKMEFVTFLLSNKIPILDINTLFKNRHYVSMTSIVGIHHRNQQNRKNGNTKNNNGNNRSNTAGNSPNNTRLMTSFGDETLLIGNTKRHTTPKHGVQRASSTTIGARAHLG